MAVTEIFHITHVSNLPRIIQTGGLWSDADRLRLGLEVTNIGHSHIKERRLRTPLPASVAQGTFVGQYVPFYCAPRSPMLYTINLGNVSGYEDGQRPVVHLVMQAEVFPAGECVVSDGNASDALTKFYAGHSALRTKVDWPLMTERFWNDTDEDGDRKRRRQADSWCTSSYTGSAQWPSASSTARWRRPFGSY